MQTIGLIKSKSNSEWEGCDDIFFRSLLLVLLLCMFEEMFFDKVCYS